MGESIFIDIRLRSPTWARKDANPGLALVFATGTSKCAVSTRHLFTCGSLPREAEKRDAGVLPKWEIEQYTELFLFPFNLPSVSLPLFC